MLRKKRTGRTLPADFLPGVREERSEDLETWYARRIAEMKMKGFQYRDGGNFLIHQLLWDSQLNIHVFYDAFTDIWGTMKHR